MRRIGRLRSEASPSKVAVIPWPPTTPIISRQPVPALPKSSVSRGGGSAPSPGPRIRHWPGARRSISAPSASQALPVPSTSSPSSSPSTFVSPQVEEAEQKGAMGDRFVARRPEPPFERSRALGAERRRRGWMRRMGGHLRSFLWPGRLVAPRPAAGARITGAGACRPSTHMAH